MLKEKNYLLSVLGLSIVPKLVTVSLTLFCFPLMIRSMGIDNYGMVVYITAIIAVLESFVDFGVSSAAGKGIAQSREISLYQVRSSIRDWALLQLKCAVWGFLPLMALSYLFLRVSHAAFSYSVLSSLVFAAWIGISLNFARASLTSTLAYKFLAILDTFESIIRSGGWLFVALLMPTAQGLAYTQLAVTIITSLLAFVLLKINLSRYFPQHINQIENIQSTKKGMIKDSLNFLWLRLVTRLFNATPSILFGNLFGPELVGALGAFAKIAEILNFPFAIIGNALSVRAHGVVLKGSAAINALWDTVTRLISLAIVAAGAVYLGSDVLVAIFLGHNNNMGFVFPILSVTILSNALSAIIAPMSDYIGALNSRNLLMSVFIPLQVAMIWLAGHYLHIYGAVIAYVLCLLSMNSGYVRIALQAFFLKRQYRLKLEIYYFVFIVITAFAFVIVFDKTLIPYLHLWYSAILNLVLFSCAILLGVYLNKSVKEFFLTKQFFEFQNLAEY